MWFVYAIYNRTVDKIYIGQTGNLEARLAEHTKKRGNHYTAKLDGIWELIYKEQAKNRREALVRERQLKSSRGREFIKKFIPL